MKQVSIFTANTKGAMNEITRLMKDADINIIALVTNDSAEFGVVRMIVSDPEKAENTLKEADYLVKISEVIGVKISDECGGLNALLEDISRTLINVDYLYISYLRDEKEVVAVFHVTDIAELREGLSMRGWSTL